jgi:hypothetical protein
MRICIEPYIWPSLLGLVPGPPYQFYPLMIVSIWVLETLKKRDWKEWETILDRKAWGNHVMGITAYAMPQRIGYWPTLSVLPPNDCVYLSVRNTEKEGLERMRDYTWQAGLRKPYNGYYSPFYVSKDWLQAHPISFTPPPNDCVYLSVMNTESEGLERVRAYAWEDG